MKTTITDNSKEIEKVDGTLFLNGHKTVRAVAVAHHEHPLRISHYVYQISNLTLLIELDKCKEVKY